jgi:YbgC/YbaW family acyl-CoA thioester hydrolase
VKQKVVERKIMWGDLDPLGIVFYPRYYEWIDASGHLFFDEILGMNLERLWQERKILFGLVESSCRYFKPGRYYQTISIGTEISSLEEKTLTLRHSIRCVADNALLVEGMEKRICLDVSAPEQLRAIEIPPDIYAVIRDAAAV